MKVFTKSAVCMLLLAAGSAFAQAKKPSDDGSYVEASWGRWSIKPGSSTNFAPTSLRGIYGWGSKSSSYEAIVYLGGAADTVTLAPGEDPDSGATVTSKVDLKMSGYAFAYKGSTNLSDSLELFGRAGIGRYTATATTTTTSGTSKDSDKLSAADTSLLLGGGVKYNFSQSVGATFDYSFFGKGVSMLAAGVAFSF
jgi:opacity protein-like surface antigen